MPAKGTHPKRTLLSKLTTKEYFGKVLSDELEMEYWQAALQRKLDLLQLRALERIVEYKRGKPIQPTEVSGALSVTHGLAEILAAARKRVASANSG